MIVVAKDLDFEFVAAGFLIDSLVGPLAQ